MSKEKIQPDYYSPRSILCTPGYKIDPFIKGHFLEADANLLDFEDSVPENRKEEARQNWKKLRQEQIPGFNGVRINSITELNGLRDIFTLLESECEADFIILPKVEHSYEIFLVDRILSEAGKKTKLWAVIETPKGIINVDSIVFASKRLNTLCFGLADYSADTGISMEWESMLYARAKIVTAACAAEIKVIDSPTFQLNDSNLLMQDSIRAKKTGFTGKVAIHPNQINIINDVFGDVQKSLEWAEQIVKKFKDKENNIFVVNDSMIGPPFLRKAMSIINNSKKNKE